jgi:ADP-ribosyl-[dinitrogen reductase] hydrolase
MNIPKYHVKKIYLNKKMNSSSSINLNFSNYLKSDEFLDRIKGCYYGQFIGDSLAMPVHWYYDINQLKKDFGEITKYEAPKSTFPNSILNLSNTDGPGRGSDKGTLIGDVILHGKKKFWQRGKSYHYHHGMNAGDNTLDTLINRVLYRNIIKNRKYDEKSFLEDYVKFMTTPDTHNDVYCGSSIRIFFKNYSLGKPLEKCAGSDGHNTDAIDALVIIIPIILKNILSDFGSDEIKRNSEIESSIICQRLAKDTLKYAFAYSELLISIFKREKDIRSLIQETGLKFGYDIAKVATSLKSDPMTACYIESSFPAMLIYAYKYAEDPEKMLLASANGGGENVARGALLGALIGAEFGLSKFPKNLVEGLTEREAISKEMNEFINVFI